jgi:hypothetical protein
MIKDRKAAIATGSGESRTKDRDSKGKLAVMQILTASTFFLVLCALPATAQIQLQPDPASFLIRVNEATIDNESAVTSTDCILVMPEGRFHLEHRRQQLPNPIANLKIFESSLEPAQLQQLQDILNDQSMQNLPPYALPVFPLNLPWFANVDVRIVRQPRVQEIGYWVWRGGAPDASPNSTPDSVKKGWQESEIALRGLMEWFHGVEALRLRPSGAKSSMCGALQTGQDREAR